MEQHYRIVRSALRKRLTITVERDRTIVVHAPTGITEEKIHQAVALRRDWIREKVRHSQKYGERPHPPGPELVNGESILYLGQRYQIEIIEEHSEAIEFRQKFLVPVNQVEQGREAFIAWYRRKAEEIIPPRTRRYAELLGVHVKRLRIVDNRYRWGACTPAGTITLNWRLIKAPVSVVDYVIVHELAHLIEANHSTAFWNIVHAQLMHVERAKLWLKENGELLEEDL